MFANENRVHRIFLVQMAELRRVVSNAIRDVNDNAPNDLIKQKWTAARSKANEAMDALELFIRINTRDLNNLGNFR